MATQPTHLSPVRNKSKSISNSSEAAALVRRVGRGDPQAETELFQLYSAAVMSFLRSRSSNLELAEDLHQETFQVVLLRLRSTGVNQPARISGFILRTARNLWIQHCRKAARRGDLLRAADLGPNHVSENPLRSIRNEELRASLRQALGCLRSERDRELLERFYLAEEDKQRLCDDYRLGSLQFNVVLFRARQRLKAEFKSRPDLQ